MQINVLNWNVAGAKFLETKNQRAKTIFRNKLNKSLKDLIKDPRTEPDLITLQEIVQYNKPGESVRNIIDPIEGYVQNSFILVDTERHPYVSKWRKVREKGNWPKGSYFGQGTAILWRENLPHFPVWELPDMEAESDGNCHIEEVILMSGLYFGDRDTEPRAATVAHFAIQESYLAIRKVKKPLDIFVVNLHLTTLTGEREGVPEIDQEGGRVRLAQLDTVLNGIVSRYNDWRRSGYRFRGEKREPEPGEDFDRLPPIWILCGDFNFTPESAEHAHMSRANFVDLHPNKGHGTKGSGYGRDAKPTLTCDYIFAGPQYIALNPIFTKLMAQGNPPPFDHIKVSDHFPLFAEIPLSTPQLERLSDAGF
ncbi:MAG TPA: endonuclease/exonuclease/phosphatase family protein [Sedimentisphaerales bacterium]|nr:endonuclease/exonuclease/phosphatase family protein [Sedimentisphaerales bacterium]